MYIGQFESKKGKMKSGNYNLLEQIIMKRLSCPSITNLMQKDQDFQDSLGYIDKLCLKKAKQNKMKQ